MAIASINSNLATQSSNLNSIWSRINVNQARNILENFKSKKRILTNIRTLSKEDDMTLSNQLHETELKRELDGLLIDAWSVE
jgi:hypothetical protein